MNNINKTFLDYLIKKVLFTHLFTNINTNLIEREIASKLMIHIPMNFKVDVFCGYFDDITVQVYIVDSTNNRTKTLINNKYNISHNSTNTTSDDDAVVDEPVVDNDKFKRAMGVI